MRPSDLHERHPDSGAERIAQGLENHRELRRRQTPGSGSTVGTSAPSGRRKEGDSLEENPTSSAWTGSQDSRPGGTELGSRCPPSLLSTSAPGLHRTWPMHPIFQHRAPIQQVSLQGPTRPTRRSDLPRTAAPAQGHSPLQAPQSGLSRVSPLQGGTGSGQAQEVLGTGRLVPPPGPALGSHRRPAPPAPSSTCNPQSMKSRF